ncbi:MAG: hypothetical protein ACRC6O_07910 [Flavobacterium sp.]
MRFFQQLFRFYINSSIHVGFSCLALFLVTQQQLFFTTSFSLIFFVFFGTSFAYNFVKYEAVVRIKKSSIRKKLKGIIIFTGLIFVALVWFFVRLKWQTQVGAFVILVLTLLYALPFFPNRSNARNWKGIKIYIVALCWTLVTVLLPILEGGGSLDVFVLLYGLQRFLLVFILILIFEIVDLKNDDPLLQTVPQQIGVKHTKKVGYGLLIVFFVLGVLSANFSFISLLLALTTAVFLAFANEKCSPYYTSFWVEAIPIFWWISLLLFQ